MPAAKDARSANQRELMNGLLLVNVGTPDEPTPAAVRRYLREFLGDGRVIDIHPIARSLLLNLIILPLRPRRSAAAYQKIWTPQGSPLLVHSRALAEAISARLGTGWVVRLGMRYGNPSLATALTELLAQGCQRLVVLPLYPQQASSTTGAAIEGVFDGLRARQSHPSLSIVSPFYDDPGFLAAWARHGQPIIESERPDHVLFSFHGLPERQIRKADDERCQDQPGATPHCLTRSTCCDDIGGQNAACYRAQSFATARLLAERLGIPVERYSVCFQSRLGRTPWIRPYTDHVLSSLLAAGKRRIVVFCPAFVADCLETLEEIGLRAREDFLAQGGESMTVVPAPNADPAWADALVALIRRQIPSPAASEPADAGPIKSTGTRT